MINKSTLFIFNGHIHGLTGSKITISSDVPLPIVWLSKNVKAPLIKIPDQSHIFGIYTIPEPLTQKGWP